MPQPYKGRRVKMTIRLPLDVHAEAAARAHARRWPLGEYVAWCVEKTVNPGAARSREKLDPDLDSRTPEGLRSARMRAEVNGG
jgi:hypothetical protein